MTTTPQTHLTMLHARRENPRRLDRDTTYRRSKAGAVPLKRVDAARHTAIGHHLADVLYTEDKFGVTLTASNGRILHRETIEHPAGHPSRDQLSGHSLTYVLDGADFHTAMRNLRGDSSVRFYRRDKPDRRDPVIELHQGTRHYGDIHVVGQTYPDIEYGFKYRPLDYAVDLNPAGLDHDGFYQLARTMAAHRIHGKNHTGLSHGFVQITAGYLSVHYYDDLGEIQAHRIELQAPKSVTKALSQRSKPVYLEIQTNDLINAFLAADSGTRLFFTENNEPLHVVNKNSHSVVQSVPAGLRTASQLPIQVSSSQAALRRRSERDAQL